jgi:RNA polymerase sigma-70 factor (ECF subfamily)
MIVENDPMLNANVADSTLLAELMEGNELAFQAIYYRYADTMLGYAADRLRCREEAEEIIQDVFVWLWSHHDRLPTIDHLRPYLYGMVKHKIFNLIRWKVIRREYIDELIRNDKITDTTTTDMIDLWDTIKVIDGTINNLPKRCGEAFRHSRIERKPIMQIARDMKISERTVQNYITTGLAQLRKNVKSFYQRPKNIKGDVDNE